jgi:hypothetical protein
VCSRGIFETAETSAMTTPSTRMFFYLLHLYTLMILYKIALAVFGLNHGTRFGADHVYWIWICAAVLAFVLYFPCRAFANYKRRSKRAWVRYF